MLNQEVSLTRGQYWLLEAAVECRSWLAGLNDEDFYRPALNRSSHGMSDDVLIRTLTAMLRDGVIEIVTRGDHKLLHPSEVELLEIVNSRNSDVLYGLTSRGGALWESFAFPRWDRYMTDEGSEEVDESGRRQAVLLSLHEGNCGRFKNDLDRYLISKGRQPAEIVSRRVVAPWQATYWKQFDRGHEVVLKFAPIEDEEWIDRPVSLTYSDGWYHMRI
jgi:hypothetical protein